MPKLQEIILEEDRLFIGDAVPEIYLTDHYVKDIPTVYAVALPKTHQEVVELVKRTS